MRKLALDVVVQYFSRRPHLIDKSNKFTLGNLSKHLFQVFRDFQNPIQGNQLLLCQCVDHKLLIVIVSFENLLTH